MKKLNMAEAATVVGGTFFCKTTYEWANNGGTETCNRVYSCTSKFGPVNKTYLVAPNSYCKQTG